MSWDRSGPLLAGGVIVAAAVYQLTPLKDVCLDIAAARFSFLLEHWRPGPVGARGWGARHGLWCIGCCWALMAALFALGVMSIPWMAMIAVFIAVENCCLAPGRHDDRDRCTVALASRGPRSRAGARADAPAPTMPEMTCRSSSYR